MKKTNQKDAAKILLVIDHTLIRTGLEAVINKQADLSVCDRAINIADTLEKIDANAPDLVITDTSLQSSSWLELVKAIKSRSPSMPVLVTSMHSESIYAERALRAGATGLMMKTESVDDLLDAIRQVRSGRYRIPKNLPLELLQSASEKSGARDKFGVDALSDRELEVFEFIGQGETSREIAAKLQLSVKTIETHRVHIKQKLKIETSSELMHRAFHWVESGRRLG